MKRSDFSIAWSAVLACVPGTALAQDTLSEGGTFGWLWPLFRVRYPLAYDYILLVAAPIMAITIAIFYYRGVLLNAVLAMQPPSTVRLRAVGLCILVSALVLMLAPNLPVGWLLVFAIAGAIMASSFGLSALIAALLLVAAVALVTLKAMHVI